MSTGFIERKISKEKINKRKMLCGVGINDAPYVVHPMIDGKRVYCSCYLQWRNLIVGNYGKRAIASGDNCGVYSPWLRFSVFKEWMKQQDWKGMSLDKDIILPGNKMYGPDICAFVSHRVNDLITPYAYRKLPRGVSYRSNDETYSIHVAYSEKYAYEKGAYMGGFKTVRKASDCWLEYKERTVVEVCTTLTDSRVIKGLMLHMELLKKESLNRVTAIEAED